MAQFDVYRNINKDTADFFPYLLDIQNDLLSSLQTRVVVPLGVGINPIRHLNPIFRVENQEVVMSTADMAGVSLAYCGELVINLSDKQDEIIDAIDFLVNGF
jgi:toxin CcdB